MSPGSKAGHLLGTWVTLRQESQDDPMWLARWCFNSKPLNKHGLASFLGLLGDTRMTIFWSEYLNIKKFRSKLNEGTAKKMKSSICLQVPQVHPRKP